MKNFWTKQTAVCIALILFSSFINDIKAQELGITFKIINSKKEPVPFASVKIKLVSDTANLQQKLTDSLGVLNFDLLRNHLYKLEATSINYKPIEKTINTSGTQTSFIL